MPVEAEIVSSMLQNEAASEALESDDGLWDSINGLVLYTEVSGGNADRVILLGKSCDKIVTSVPVSILLWFLLRMFLCFAVLVAVIFRAFLFCSPIA